MVASGVRQLTEVDTVLDWLKGQGARRVVVDSRQVQPGDAFVAWPGAAHDARGFVQQALGAGAVACLVAAEGVEAYAFDDERIAAMPDLKRLVGDLCAAFHGHPSERLTVAAVTGTNGKTSTAWWLAQASGLLGQRAGIVGTLGVGEPPVGERAGHWESTGLTTPDPAALHARLAGFVREGFACAALEASSIGIVEHRLQGLSIHTALFTNLTQDHLDYHGTMERYWAAKRQLFDWPTLKAAVINIDDAQGAHLAQELAQARPALDRWTVGFTAGARLRALTPAPTASGMRFSISEQGAAPVEVVVPFVGSYNILNLLGVVAGLRSMGHPLAKVVRVLPLLTAVPGRMQALGGAGEPLAVVDYAHTPDALEKALLALRPVATARGGRLWCVFGCGGDRDRTKRPLMGGVAARLADAVVLTSDNPRREDPHRILADVRSGMGEWAGEVQVDRRLAVHQALAQAACRDVVLVAGKGHEDYQDIQGVRHPCRDVDLVQDGLRQRPVAGFMTVGDVMACLGPSAVLTGDASVPIRRVHTDTRSLQPGDLYVALKGERFDGHAFLDQVHAAGAAAVLAERGVESSGLPGLTVADSLAALQALARAWRRQLALPVVAVTGSNGKTTVTQMIGSILRAWQGERAGGTKGNLNNHIGVPLSVLSLRAGEAFGHRAAVFELGMNHPGEVSQLAAMAQPTVALVNNAQREHQEFMQTVDAVASENGAVLKSLPPHGVAVFPAQDPYAPLWRDMAGGVRQWTFSWEVSAGVEPIHAKGTVHGRAVWKGDHWQLRMEAPDGLITAQVHLPGRHNVHNAVAAATAALAAGAPALAVAQGLSSFAAVAGRSKLVVLPWQGRAVALIDDTYNANPDSVRAAIEVLAELPGPQALVLGDMGEVGEQGPAFHQEVGLHARQAGLDRLWTVGTLCRHAAQAYGSGARHFESMDDLMAALPGLSDCQAIVVKGSRFMQMERVVKALQSLAQEGR